MFTVSSYTLSLIWLVFQNKYINLKGFEIAYQEMSHIFEKFWNSTFHKGLVSFTPPLNFLYVYVL